ncbi:hypothetical protein [Jannaschia ovalis]|uniref:DoxX family protein n=1 Tax=Jannaschia ovalis TaxID=3038773 RepID=A0ABY8LDK6_9RHOB|nr:hypothetical protein [Jannaschia sp. GRR-S6-38]WGH78468.1 hypothetical protein P8627_15845 [Jannaschia sp. GRR-S6-38]
MSLSAATTAPLSRRLSLVLLRVTTGFLLIWFGLDKIVSGSAPLFVRRAFELSDGAAATIGLLTGGAEVAIGGLCVLGLFRSVALPLQAVINGITAAGVWWAIVDPFRWWVTGVDRIVFNSHVFYPTSITFAACLLLIAFRAEDRFALDTLRAGARRQASSSASQ